MLYDELVKWLTRLQKQVDGLIKPEVPVLTSWTATVTQSGSVTISSQTSYYVLMPPLVWVHAFITVSGAGVAGNAIRVGGQPSAIQAAGGQVVIGEGRINDISVTDYQGLVHVGGAADWYFRYGNGSSYIGAVPSFALANGDSIEINCIYRIS